MTLLQTVFTLSNVGIGSAIILGFATLGIKINSNSNKRFASKADKGVVDDKFKIMHEKINDKADKSAMKEMSGKIDMIHDYIINKK